MQERYRKRMEKISNDKDKEEESINENWERIK